jgi:hypothetical protein
MSPQDAQLLQDFLNQLVQARGIAKDPEADAMIAKAVAQQPDAPYLLVQRALLLQQALNNAKAEIAALQNQLRAAPQTAPAFLDPNAWGNSGAARPAPVGQSAPVAPQQYQPPYQAPYQPQYQPQYQLQFQPPMGSSPGFLRGGMGSTLGNIAATAAGVAGGAFLFQGIENMLGHHGGNGFLGPQGALNPLSATSESSTVNNFFGNDTQPDLAEKFGLHSPDNLTDNTGSDNSADLTDNLDSNLFDTSSDDDSII